MVILSPASTSEPGLGGSARRTGTGRNDRRRGPTTGGEDRRPESAWASGHSPTETQRAFRRLDELPVGHGRDQVRGVPEGRNTWRKATRRPQTARLAVLAALHYPNDQRVRATGVQSRTDREDIAGLNRAPPGKPVCRRGRVGRRIGVGVGVGWASGSESVAGYRHDGITCSGVSIRFRR